MSGVGTVTLTDFLLARIAEDEARAHRNHYWTCPAAQSKDGRCECGQQRPLAECEAKRAIVGIAQMPWFRMGEQDGLHYALTHLAAIYADHPDCRDEWRP